MIDVTTSVREQIARQFVVEPVDEGLRVVAPLGFTGGTVADISVAINADGTYTASDRGLAASELALFGIDVTRGAAKTGWDQILRELRPFRLLHAPSELEISGSASADQAGILILAVMDAFTRAAGLQYLRPSHPQTAELDARIVSLARKRRLRVRDGAMLVSSSGVERKLTAHVRGPSREGWIKAFGGSANAMDVYDRSRSLFSDATPPKEARFTIVTDDLALTNVQELGIGAYSTLVREHDAERLLDSLAAA